jgi:hypothetical protein
LGWICGREKGTQRQYLAKGKLIDSHWCGLEFSKIELSSKYTVRTSANLDICKQEDINL